MRLQLRQIYFNNFIIICFGIQIYGFISTQFRRKTISQQSNIISSCCNKIFCHFFVIGKNGCRCTSLRPHITNCSLPGTRKFSSSFPPILQHRICRSFNCQNTKYLQYHILGRHPRRQFSGQFHSYNTWHS